MIKSELVQKIAARNENLSVREAEAIVSEVLTEITEALARGDRVELRGFGSFSVKKRPPRGSNPLRGPRATNEIIGSRIADKLDEINKSIEAIL